MIHRWTVQLLCLFGGNPFKHHWQVWWSHSAFQEFMRLQISRLSLAIWILEVLDRPTCRWTCYNVMWMFQLSPRDQVCSGATVLFFTVAILKNAFSNTAEEWGQFIRNIPSSYTTFKMSVLEMMCWTDSYSSWLTWMKGDEAGWDDPPGFTLIHHGITLKHKAHLGQVS